MFKLRISVHLVILATILGACGQTAAPSSSVAPSSMTPSSVAGGSTVSPASPSPATLPSATPEPRPSSPTPPAPERARRWSTEARRVIAAHCLPPAATVDGSGRFHVAAICDGKIRYATSTNGRSWKTSSLPAPSDGFDEDLQLAVDGSRVYVAYTHLLPVEQDTCGGETNRSVVGVYYRSRALPDGKWSKATRIGQRGDQLQSLRVVDGVIHETVVTDDGTGPVFYSAVRGADSSRIRIPEAEATSLRVGDDGRPRIAFTTGRSVGYAVVTGERLTIDTIFSFDDVGTESPVLVLGNGDRAFVSWAATGSPEAEGCGDGPTPTHEGTWFATDAGGRWSTKRLSKQIGAASLVLDVERGRVHAIYDDGPGIRYATRAADGTWSGSRIGVRFDLNGSVLRRDARSGTLLLVANGFGADDETPGIYAFTAS